MGGSAPSSNSGRRGGMPALFNAIRNQKEEAAYGRRTAKSRYRNVDGSSANRPVMQPERERIPQRTGSMPILSLAAPLKALLASEVDQSNPSAYPSG
jgi:hypothetical protein